MDKPIQRDLQEIRELSRQAWSLRKENRHKALQMAVRAQSLLEDCPDALPVDEFDALKTQAYCLDRIGKPEEALAVGLKAHGLALQLDDALSLCIVENLLGRIFWHIDDFPTALNHFLAALKVLPERAPDELEISVINGLGLVQFGLGNYQEALEHFKTCLEKAETGVSNGRADANNNIAYVLHMVGRSQEALEYGTTALALQKQLQAVGGIMETLHSLGAIHLSLGHHDKALILLNEGLDLARLQNSQLLEVTFAAELCKLHTVIGDFVQAKALGLEALELAQQIGSVSNIANIEKMLADICKAQGEMANALAHFQAYHEAYIKIFNGRFDQRIKALEIIRELELSRQQTDLYRELAGTDVLTRLLNRRGLLEHLSLAMARSKRQDSIGAVQFIDLDLFKQLNDTHGHVVGDRLLTTVAERLKAVVRASDVVARYGGDEFVVLMEGLGTDPQLASESAKKMADKIRLALAEPYDLGEIRYTTQASVGSTQFSGDEVSVESVLKKADAAMYAEKKSRQQADHQK